MVASVVEWLARTRLQYGTMGRAASTMARSHVSVSHGTKLVTRSLADFEDVHDAPAVDEVPVVPVAEPVQCPSEGSKSVSFIVQLSFSDTNAGLFDTSLSKPK